MTDQGLVAFSVTKEMICAGHDVLLKRGIVLSYEILTEIKF
jgi:hypothetical protein